MEDRANNGALKVYRLVMIFWLVCTLTTPLFAGSDTIDRYFVDKKGHESFEIDPSIAIALDHAIDELRKHNLQPSDFDTVAVVIDDHKYVIGFWAYVPGFEPPGRKARNLTPYTMEIDKTSLKILSVKVGDY